MVQLPPIHNTSLKYSCTIFFLSLVIGFALLVLSDVTIPERGDSPVYMSIAQSIASGKGYSYDGVKSTALRMPLYPLFLAGIITISGPHVRAAQAFQVLLNSMVCLLIFQITLRLIDRKHALIAGLLIACYIPNMLWSLNILTEPLFIFLVTASLFFLVTGKPSNSPFSCVVSGLIMGLASLTRQNGLVIAFFMALWLLRREKLKKQAILYFSIVLVVMSPWVVRNALVFHRFIPFDSLVNVAFYGSVIVPEKGFGFDDFKGIQEEYYSIHDEGEKDTYLFRKNVNLLTTKTLHFVKLIPAKLALLVYPYDLQWYNSEIPIRYNIPWGIVSIFALIGVKTGFREILGKLSFVFYLLMALGLTTVVIWGSPRLRAPYDGFFVILASLGIVWVWSSKNRWLWITGITFVNVLLLLTGNIPYLFQVLNEIMKFLTRS
ncbi:glycosyltransferase family 39 protein [bacterium]|nr:glycosyltransferase family 39 protein [bacterium]